MAGTTSAPRSVFFLHYCRQMQSKMLDNLPNLFWCEHHALHSSEPLHRGALRVLDLDPRRAPPGAVARITALAHDRITKEIRRCGALLPLFRLVGALCIAALWRVKSLLRHHSNRPHSKKP